MGTLGMVTRYVNQHGATVGLIIGEISGFTMMVLTNLPAKKAAHDTCMIRKFTTDKAAICTNIQWCGMNSTDRWDISNELNKDMLGQQNWAETCTKSNDWSFGMNILQISYTYYSTFQLILTTVVALAVSAVTQAKSKSIEDRLLIPALRRK